MLVGARQILRGASMRGLRVKPTSVDEYLAALPAEQRAALEKLRRDIRAAAPGAEECIAYQLPSFRLDGRHLVSFGAAARHCAFYPGAVVEEHLDELESYQTSKGTIRFQPERPLPAALVRKLVKAQIASRAAEAHGGSGGRSKRDPRPRAPTRGASRPTSRGRRA
jgi:uncharacterized protein YdhG (YjbR/CyaY superfamily)